MPVVVASENWDKVLAVARSFGVLPEQVLTCKVGSGVSEAPKGEETLQGALNRWRNACEHHSDPNTMVVSVENGVWPVADEPDIMQDRAVVVLGYPGQSPVNVLSDPVYYPKRLQDEADARGVTIGIVMRDRFSYNSSNWHRNFDKDNRDRVQLISEAITKGMVSLVQMMSVPVREVEKVQ